jgi:hypothetical protein
MSEMLLKQEAINQLGDKGKEATDAQLKAARELQSTEKGRAMSLGEALEEIQAQENATKKFEDAVRKLQTVFTDIFSQLEPIIDSVAGMVKNLAESPFAKVAIVAVASVGALTSAAKMFTGMRGAAPFFPLYTSDVGAGGAGATGGLGGALKGKMARGLGLGAVAALAGTGLEYAADQADPESGAAMGLGIGGNALQYAGTGAMIGSFGGPAGMAIGAGLGAVVGGFMGYMERKEEREKAAEEKKNQAETQRAEKQSELLRQLAEREVKLMLDGNKLGQGLSVTNYRV